MVQENRNYPYLNAYNDKIKAFSLVETIYRPQRVSSSKHATFQGTSPGTVGMMTLSGQHGTAEVILDFERELVGHAKLYLKAGHETTLSVFYGEDYPEAAREEPYQSDWYVRPVDNFTLKAGEQTLRTTGRKAWRYLKIQIPQGDAAVQISDVQAVLVHYPVKKLGRFSCSDERLNQIWQMSAYTTKLCMQQFYEDGIKRDGLLWVGDYRLEFLNAWFAFGDAALARKSLYLFAATQREDGAIPACAGKSGGHQHPDNIDYMPGIPHGFVDSWMILNYMSDFVSALWEYHRMTGDRQTMADLWPAVLRGISFLLHRVDFEKPDLGITVQNGTPADPVCIITDVMPGEGDWRASNGTFLFQLTQAVLDALRMAEILQATKDIANLKDILQTLDMAVSPYLSPEFGLYTDKPVHTAQASDISRHANMFSILSGRTTPKDGKGMMEKMDSLQLPRPNAGFMLCWQNAAHFQCGNTQKAIDNIRRDWGRMLNEGATTCWERLDATDFNREHPDFAPASLCHGWTAGPAYQLPMYLLGVQPAEPGFKRVIVRPDLGDLQWVEGTVPTPQGEIVVRWEAAPSLSGTVTLPQGVEGRLITPDGREYPLHPGMNAVESI